MTLDQDSMLLESMTSQRQRLLDHLINIHLGFFRGRLLYESAYSSYDSAGASAVCNDFLQSATQYLRLKIMLGKQPEARVAVIGYRR